jgi:hypothetical protein
MNPLNLEVGHRRRPELGGCSRSDCGEAKKTGDLGLLGLENDLVDDNIYRTNYNNLLRHEAGQFGEAPMQQQKNQTLSQRLQEYQASKTVLFWACAGSVMVATIVGFSWGGWVTGGSAQEMAEESAAQARQELAAVVCVDRFMAAPDAGVQLTVLQEITTPRAQGKFVEDGGWAIIVPASSPTDYKARADDRKAAGLCAEELAKREMPTAEKAELTNDDAAIVQ